MVPNKNIKYSLLPAVLLFLLLPAAGLFAQANKIYVSPFVQKTGFSQYDYFAASLPRSIRGTIRPGHPIENGETDRDSRELIQQGFAFKIKGMYSIKDNLMTVTFSLIYLKTNTVVIVVFARGYVNERIFDMIDGLSKLILENLKKPLASILERTLILSVGTDGKISVSTDSLAGLDLSGGNFQGADFSNRDLQRANLSGANLSRVNFGSADLRGANLSGAALNGALFRRSSIAGADFRNTSGILIEENIMLAKDYIKAIYDDEINAIIKLPNLYIGVNVSAGISYDLFNVSAGDSVFTRFTGSLSARFLLHLYKNFGFHFDVGYMVFRAKEAGDTYAKSYDIHYAFLSACPTVIFDKIYFYTGPFVSFLLSGRAQDGATVTTGREGFTPVVMGISIGAGYTFYLKRNSLFMVGFEVKTQLMNYLKSTGVEKQFFSAMLSFSFLFLASSND